MKKPKRKYLGTRIWLRLEGIHSPPEEFVHSFHRTMLIRCGIMVTLVIAALAAWFWFLRSLH
jgi:hypothetical protein